MLICLVPARDRPCIDQVICLALVMVFQDGLRISLYPRFLEEKWRVKLEADNPKIFIFPKFRLRRNRYVGKKYRIRKHEGTFSEKASKFGSINKSGLLLPFTRRIWNIPYNDWC